MKKLGSEAHPLAEGDLVAITVGDGSVYVGVVESGRFTRSHRGIERVQVMVWQPEFGRIRHWTKPTTITTLGEVDNLGLSREDLIRWTSW